MQKLDKSLVKYFGGNIAMFSAEVQIPKHITTGVPGAMLFFEAEIADKSENEIFFALRPYSSIYASTVLSDSNQDITPNELFEHAVKHQEEFLTLDIIIEIQTKIGIKITESLALLENTLNNLALTGKLRAWEQLSLNKQHIKIEFKHNYRLKTQQIEYYTNDNNADFTANLISGHYEMTTQGDNNFPLIYCGDIVVGKVIDEHIKQTLTNNDYSNLHQVN